MSKPLDAQILVYIQVREEHNKARELPGKIQLKIIELQDRLNKILLDENIKDDEKRAIAARYNETINNMKATLQRNARDRRDSQGR